METTKTRPEWLSIQDVAVYLGVSTITVRRLVWSGVLPVSKVGVKLHRIRRKDLEDFMESGKRKGPETPNPGPLMEEAS